MKLEALPFAVAVTLLAALPSYFNLATHQIFEEQKALLLRAGALVAVPALITMWRPEMRRGLTDPLVLLFGALLAVLALATVFAIAPQDALMGAHLRRHGFLTWAAVAVLFMALLPPVRTTSGPRETRPGTRPQSAARGRPWAAFALDRGARGEGC